MKYMAYCTALILFLAAPSTADLYKWVDEDGVTHFSNTAPPSDAAVETNPEVRGKAASTGSTDLQELIENYRQDALAEENPASPEPDANESTRVSESTIRTYEERVIRYQNRVSDYERKLESAKRESYSDSRSHRKKIEHYEKLVRDYQLDLESAKRNLREAKKNN